MPGGAEMFVFLLLTDNIVRCELTQVVTILLLYLIAVFGGFKEQQYQQPCSLWLGGSTQLQKGLILAPVNEVSQ